MEENIVSTVIVEEENAEEFENNSENLVEENIEVEEINSTEETNFEELYNELEKQFSALQSQLEELQASYNALEEEFACGKKKKEEMELDYNSLKADYDNLVTNYASLNTEYSNLQEDVNNKAAALATYESAEKQRIIDKFTKVLPADIMQNISDAKDTFSIDELNTRCALEYTKFSMAKESEDEIRIPQLPKEPSALVSILNRYKK